MQVEIIGEIQVEEPIPGFRVRFAHSKHMTFAHWEIEANATLPEHSHLHEQVAYVTEGTFELTVSGETRLLSAGELAVIPENAAHSGRAITYCKIIDTFYPVRQDYL